MPTLNELITFEYQNEHVLEHDLPMTKNFSTPKIYNANNDLSKRWYVYFSFRNPETGKLERMKNIYGNSNNYKTKEDRLSVLAIYRKKLLVLLKEGFNPYQDNTALYTRRKVKQVSSPEKIENSVPIVEQPKMTLKEALDFGLKLKEKLINSTTKKNYENRIKNFLKWMKEHHPEVKTIDQLTKKSVNAFLNDVLSRTSSRTRNNARVDLSSILQVLEDEDVIALNFIKKIKVLKSIPERNKTYTKEMQEDIFNFLEEKDPILLLYIKFIAYNILRPIEVCRLNVGDLNLTNRTIQFKAKNSPLKTKLIPELLINDLPDLTKLNKELVLFTPDGIGCEWKTNINNRRDYFTKRFKAVVKDHFNLGTDYGLYSFRHTYITKIYRELVKNSSPTEAEGKLMLITGHATIIALRKYLRDIDAELPADYSEMLK
jgi:integrase